MSPLIWFILIGMAAGWIAGQFVKGSGGYGLSGDIVVGVVGAVVGGFLLSTWVGLFSSLIVATISAFVLVFFIRQLKRA